MVASLLLVVGLAAACTESEGPDSGGDSGPHSAVSAPQVRAETLRMRRRIEDRIARSDPEENPFLNASRAGMYETMLKRPLSRRDQLEIRMRYGLELVRAGKSEEAATVFADTRRLCGELSGQERDVQEWLLEQFEGLAWLRLGEQENCIALRGCDSCIFPLRGDGVHRKRRGSERAAVSFRAALQRRPDDLATLWLLNVAYMTLGEHPDGVPAKFRIPAATFRSEGSSPRFVDVAQKAGAAVSGLSGGVVLEDFDGDLDFDILCSSWGPSDPLRYLRNRGDGTFDDQSVAAGLDGFPGGLNLVSADYDGDGDVDVFVLRGAWLGDKGDYPNSLLRNDGKGRFDDVTESAGLLELAPTQTAAFADYDGDGRLDLFVAGESDGRTKSPGHLFRNEGARFRDVSALVRLRVGGFVKGVVW
ncbi:MAG: VCBS repeat-containing protein, partial [Planctomycetota bacterium]